ncbi:MAG: hypothetical protein NTW86_12805 [Candidatus Sumerlaeota bacterium]|nr:hypothetical protein [Candidatus Sumerlaeota bacterium]
MWLKWLPWKWVISQAAKRHGFLDPIAVWGRLRRFAQPSEVAEPVELLRAGAVFHSRGLINSRAIQHNLDWVWPYWACRQFDPRDPSFVPRAFSLTHVNLTHRNWTAIGLPRSAATPIVDPRGLVTPLFDGWSIDVWILADDGRELLPSRQPAASASAIASTESRLQAESSVAEADPNRRAPPEGGTPYSRDSRQRLVLDEGLAVETETASGGLLLRVAADVVSGAGGPECRIRATGSADAPAWLAIALRPYNPEGVSFIHTIELAPDRRGWRVNGAAHAALSDPVERHAVSNYRAGDVYSHWRGAQERRAVECDVGMATAMALYRLPPNAPREIAARVPLEKDATEVAAPGGAENGASWPKALEGACNLTIPGERFQFLYESALRSIVLHSAAEVYPGPYTYKRFWFRDAAFIVHALLCAGLAERAGRALERFFARQTAGGFFRSQQGEWDSNGETLWLLQRFCELTGQAPKETWETAIRNGAHWIVRKRLPAGGDPDHGGLMPAGFSAEHFGPSDFYYWDDFWSVAGLLSAAWLLERLGDAQSPARFRREADELMEAVERSLRRARERLGRAAMPAAPSRRLDAGSIGSLVAGYPLRLWPADDPRLLDTLDYLERECLIAGGFFQDIVHSGVNAYLTLHMAQVHLRAGDPRFAERMAAVAALASPTGQWPEAIHPQTRGGCMGDGQHVWASAEWILMLRNCFVREEESEGRLILGSGIPPQWLENPGRLAFGPAPTSFGPISLVVSCDGSEIMAAWKADWRAAPKSLEIRLPGKRAVVRDAGVPACGCERVGHKEAQEAQER